MSKTRCTLLENHRETFLAIFARTLSIFEAKQSISVSEGMISRSQILLEKAILLSDSNPTVILELVNYFMARDCYSEAGKLLSTIKCDPVIGCNRNVEPTDNLEESKSAIVEEPIYVDAYEDSGRLQESAHVQLQCDGSGGDDGNIEDRSSGLCVSVNEKTELSETEYSTIKSTTDVHQMDTECRDIEECLHRREGIKQFDEKPITEIGRLNTSLEKQLEAIPTVEDDDEERVHSIRPLINRNDHHDLINLFGLWQSFTKLNLKDHAESVFEKLSKNVNERQRTDKTITMGGLEHDFKLYSSLKEEPSLTDDWDDPFVLFKEHVIFTKADDHLLDDVLKAVVGQCGVVSLTVDDLYFHYRAQLLKHDNKPSEALKH